VRIFHVEADGSLLAWVLFFTMWESMWRRQYTLERQNPEQFDIGGES
jgi:hypothetical protein